MKQYKNSKKQGDAGLGQAIAYFTKNEYDVAIPLTDSCDWDLVVEKDGVLQRVQVKCSTQFQNSGNETFDLAVAGGNKTGSGRRKYANEQKWDVIYLYHLISGRQALIPHSDISDIKTTLTLHSKYDQYIV